VSANDFAVTDGPRGRAYLWPGYGFAVTASEVRRTSLGLYAELTVESVGEGRNGHVFWERLNLARADDKARAVKFLAGFCADHGQTGVPWERMLEVVRMDVRAVGRLGAPFVRLRDVPARPQRWLIDRVVPHGDPTVFFAAGGTGKSTLVAVLAVVLATGRAVPPFRPVCGPLPVVLLDWETTESEWARRVAAVCRWLDEEIPAGLVYRAQAGSLVDELDGVRAQVERLGAGAVVVDSLMGAFGGPIAPEVTTPFYNALRSLPVTPLIVHHLTKFEAAQQHGPPQMYGDVTITNRARAAWALGRDEASDGDDRIDLVLTNTKMNGAPIQRSLGVRLRHHDAESEDYAISVEQFDPLAAATVSTNLRLGDRIVAELRAGQRTEAELVEATGAARTTVMRRLDALLDRGLVERLSGGRGRGKAAAYGLVGIFDRPATNGFHPPEEGA